MPGHVLCVYFLNMILSFCQNNEGKPLLLVAAEAGLTDIVAALLIAGADPSSVHSVCCLHYCNFYMGYNINF